MSRELSEDLSSSRDPSPTTCGAVLTKAEILAKLEAGTLTMGEYLPYAKAMFRAQFEDTSEGKESPGNPKIVSIANGP